MPKKATDNIFHTLVQIIEDNRCDDLEKILNSPNNIMLFRGIYIIPRKTISPDDSILFQNLTLTHVAAYYDATECLEYLLSQKLTSDVNIKSANSMTPLHYAILGKATECTLALLSRGADPNYTPPNTPYSPLFLAARVGYLPIVNMLIDFGATIPKKTAIGKNPLKEALRCKHQDVFELMLDRGLIDSMNPQTNDFSPLMIAVSNNLDEAVALLLDKGNDPNIVSKNGLTALSLACQSKNENIIKMLLNSPSIMLSTIGAGGSSAIHWAAATCIPSIVELIIEYGANVRATTKRGENALSFALRTRPRPETDKEGHFIDIDNQLNTLKLLIKHGLSFNYSLNDKSCSVLEYLMDTSKADLKVIEYIFSTGLDLNMKVANSTLGEKLYTLKFGKYKDFILSQLEKQGFKYNPDK